MIHRRLANSVDLGVHSGMERIPTYRIHTPGSGGEAKLLFLHGLSPQSAERALRLYAEYRRTTVGTVLGVSVDGVIFTSIPDWRPGSSITPVDIVIVGWNEIRALLTMPP